MFRFVYAHSRLSRETRGVRHGIAKWVEKLSRRRDLIAARDSVRDVGAARWRVGIRRAGFRDLLTANMRRAQESARVLEEIARFRGRTAAVRGLQGLRFRLYALEKAAFGVIGRASDGSRGRRGCSCRG
jgi:thiamine-phosphate pyrophosphorylase